MSHTRKSVQMHMLAKNLAFQFFQCLNKAGVVVGDTFTYEKVVFGKIVTSNEIVTIEMFQSGEFVKYINNDGHIIPFENRNEQLLAESLTHFSYVKSKKKLLLVDIQGTGYKLFDPEIATSDGSFDDDENLKFCIGNLSTATIDKFFNEHTCNDFCKSAGLVD